MMTEYIIIKCDELRDLVNRVNESMANGYVPQGGPVFYPVYSDNSGKAWIQAMVK